MGSYHKYKQPIKVVVSMSVNYLLHVMRDVTVN